MSKDIMRIGACLNSPDFKEEKGFLLANKKILFHGSM
jgi:hypothetical protein